ncbi:MAG: anti-sigma factor RsbA family regulatory protein [Propionibacteriaceae bacterium]
MHPPLRSRQSYRHEAFLWRDEADFTASMASFVEQGVEAGEPVMVAVTPLHTRWLREVLSRDAVEHVRFVDMVRLGRNPARIIPAWKDFVSDQASPVRGIGEPIWPERHAQELLECQLHEALLNVAIDPETPLWLICPYDARALSPAVMEEAYRSHPALIEDGSYRGSPLYGGRAYVDRLFAAELGQPETASQEAVFTAGTVHLLARYAELELYVSGLDLDQATTLAAATHRLALDSLARSASHLVVRVWREPFAWICEVVDDVPVTDPLAGRSLPNGVHGGLWETNQASDLVQLRSGPAGTVARIFHWR